MKKIILFLMLLTSLSALAHQDKYIVVEKSNVSITIKVGYESSWELLIVESYAEIINNFIREIDFFTEKVFILFDEDYCFFYDDSYHIGYSDFSPYFPFPCNYYFGMNFFNAHEVLDIRISTKYFKLKPLLQLLEFGLQNKNQIIDKGKIFKSKIQKSETASIIDSILQSKSGNLINKYLSKKIIFNDIPKTLTQKNIKFFLQNDSIVFIDKNGSEILKISTINSISYEPKTDCLFIFNTNKSFYFINKNLKSNKKQYDLPFEFRCIEAIWIEYEKNRYKLEKDMRWRDIDSKREGTDWVYFDEINGITKVK